MKASYLDLIIEEAIQQEALFSKAAKTAAQKSKELARLRRLKAKEIARKQALKKKEEIAYAKKVLKSKGYSRKQMKQYIKNAAV